MREETETDSGGEKSSYDDLVGPLGDEVRTQISHFSGASPILKIRGNKNLGNRKAIDLRDKVQRARLEVERAHGEMERLVENLERKKQRATRLKRKLKEERKERRKLEYENKILNAEKRSLLIKTLDAEKKVVMAVALQLTWEKIYKLRCLPSSPIRKVLRSSSALDPRLDYDKGHEKNSRLGSETNREKEDGHLQAFSDETVITRRDEKQSC